MVNANITESNHIGIVRIKDEARMRYNPLKNLTPQKITAAMDNFNCGYLSDAAKIYAAIRRRDAVVQACVQKRKRATSRLEWTIVEMGNNEAASKEHAAFLEDFYNNIRVTSAEDANKRGSMSMLIENILSALENKYAVSEIIWDTSRAPSLSAEVRHVPLWFFENTQGYLRFKKSSYDTEGADLENNGWMVSVYDSPLMEATAVCYIVKRFAQGDWAAYSSRFGMPTPVYNSTAKRNTPEYDAAVDALANLVNGCGMVLAAGEVFDLKQPAGTGEPFKTLSDSMDRYIALIWRGSDLSTLSADNAAGASLQAEESEILEDADCALVEETLAHYLTKPALEWKFGQGVKPAAYLQLTRKNRKDKLNQIAVYKGAAELGCAVAKRDVYEALELREPEPGEDMVELSVQQPAAAGAEAQGAGLSAFGNSSEPSEEDLGRMLDALATAKGKDIEPLRKRVLALEKLTDAEEYADALEKLNADILALIGGENEAVELEKILKKEAANV